MDSCDATATSRSATRRWVARPCVRWGTYQATLTDAHAPPHPDLPDRQERQSYSYSFISDAEMRRLNIEVSANLARQVRLYRERGRFALSALLAKAHTYLPMPQRSVLKDAEATALLYGALQAGAHPATRAGGNQRRGKAGAAAVDRRAGCRPLPLQCARVACLAQHDDRGRTRRHPPAPPAATAAATLHTGDGASAPARGECEPGWCPLRLRRPLRRVVRPRGAARLAADRERARQHAL